jgi:hypothetical protein
VTDVKKIITSIATALCLGGTAVFSASAATVNLPAEFDDLAGIFEIVLKIAEFIANLVSFFF